MKWKKDDTINTFISNTHVVFDTSHQFIESFMSCETQETIKSGIEDEDILVIAPCDSIPIEIEPGKTLNISPNLSPSQLNNSWKPFVNVWKHSHGII